MFKNHKLFASDAPAAICGTLAGKVYETDDIAAVKVPYLALTEHQENGKTVMRFASESNCSDVARSISPNLEDVFLYIYRDETV
jgi:hypothetical protein